MTRIVGLSGSLRHGSFNSALLRATVEVAPPGVTIEVGSIRGIPLYDGDVEAEGIPAAVTELKERVASAEGLLLVTPEYNASIPGVFKNTIDWMSRPASDIQRVFGGRPVAVIGATPGRVGTALSQAAWFQVFRKLEMEPWCGPALYVAEAGKLFDQTGKLIDAGTRERLTKFVEGFARFVAGGR